MPGPAERVGDHHVAGVDQLLGLRERVAAGAVLELVERRGQGERVAGQRRAVLVGVVLAGAADRHLHDAGGQRTEDHQADRGDRVGAVPAAAEEQAELGDERDRRGHGAGDGRREDVAVVDVHQLVAEDAAQLALVEQLQDALGAADRGVLRVATGGERVGRVGGGDVEPRHRLLRLVRELADDPVHRRLLLLGHRVGVHRLEGELVGVPVAVGVHAERDQHGDDQAAAAEEAADHDDRGRHAAQQEGGLESVEVAMAVHVR